MVRQGEFPLSVSAPRAEKRRQLLLIAAALALAPSAAAQRQPRVARVGFLLPAKHNEPLLKPYRERLAAMGWVEGRNLATEVRTAENRYELGPALTGELVRLKCDVIVAASTALALAAKQAAPNTPVVFTWVSDPVASGLVKTLGRPGGNLTGLSNLVLEVAPKQLELLKALDPRLQRAAALTDARLGTSRPYTESAARAATTLGLSLLELDAGSPAGIDRAFDAAVRGRATAMILPPHPLYAEHREHIAQLALRHRVASAFQARAFVVSGGLLSYGIDLVDGFLRTAKYVDKILRGAKPADLPVEQADRFEIVLNRKTAAALGLTIPQSVLLQATEVIE